MPTSPLSRSEIEHGVGRVMLREAAGIDRLRPRDVDRRALFLAVWNQLRGRGFWKFKPGRLGVLKRPGKSDRHHVIPTLWDAVILGATAHALGREVWPQLPTEIQGHRPKSDYKLVIGEVSEHLRSGAGAVLKFDIRQAFARASPR